MAALQFTAIARSFAILCYPIQTFRCYPPLILSYFAVGHSPAALVRKQIGDQLFRLAEIRNHDVRAGLDQARALFFIPTVTRLLV